MKNLFNKHLLCVSFLSMLFGMPDSFGVPLVGTVSVNQSSDTAANAKINATNHARRQILFEVLSNYSDKGALGDLLKNTSNENLMNLISSTAVSNEQISANGYSADIQMNIDNDAAKKWLNSNNVQNWVPLGSQVEKFAVVITVSNGIPDWAEIKRIARVQNIELETQSMSGNQVVVKIPVSYRTKFTAAMREAGWRYSDNNGVLNIWK